MMRFRQWWWRMLIALMAGCVVSVAMDVADANTRFVPAAEIAIRSLIQMVLDSEIARMISTLAVYSLLPILVALCLYHILIRRAYRRIKPTSTDPPPPA